MARVLVHWFSTLSLRQDTAVKWLSINRVIRELTNKATLLFFPIFIFEIGQTLPFPGHMPTWTKGILLVVMYHVLLRCLVLVGMLPFSKLTERLPSSSVLVISYLFRCLFFAILLFVADQPWLLGLAVVVEAIEISLFWPRYSMVLAEHSPRASVAGNLGIIQFSMQLLGAVVPVIAVLIGAAVGTSSIFLLGIVGSLLGLLTAFQLHLPVVRDTVSLKEFARWLQEHRYHRYLLAVGGRVMNDYAMYIWPLYIYLLFASFIRVGFLTTASLLIALLVTLFAGMYLDKLKSARSFHLTGFILAAVWLARTQVITPAAIALIDSVDKVISIPHWLFFDMIWYRRAKGREAYSYFVYHEMVASAWIIATWFMILFLLLLTHSFTAIFVMGALGVSLSLLLRGKHSEPVS